MKSGAAGVINLVSYGYHESRAVKAPSITRTGKVNESFLAQ